MRATTVFGRGGRRRVSRFYWPASILSVIRTIRNFAWGVARARRRNYTGSARTEE